jgi:hypothetical protein
MEKTLIQAIDDNNNILLTGGAGVGKTYHTNQIIAHLKKRGKKFAVCAMTGLASQHLDFGMTIHRFLGVGGHTKKNDIFELTERKDFLKNLDSIFHISTIIIDEVSMMRSDFLELMDEVLKFMRLRASITNNIMADPRVYQPFGGYQMIFVGDFLQLPPVVPEDEEVPYKWIFQSPLFIEARFRVYCLKETKRTSDPKFANALNKLRVGYCDDETYEMIWGRTEAVLDGEATVLMSRVKSVEEFNKQRLLNEPGTMHTLSGIISVREELKCDDKLVRKLYSQILKEVPVEKSIDVKLGCRVMLLANNPTMGYMNGSQGILKDIVQIQSEYPVWTNNQGITIDLDYTYFGECLHVLLDDGRDVLVSKKAYKLYGNSFDDEGRRLADLVFFQFPITLGYAVSIHKSQGMSLDRMILDCSKIFADGQLYVGVSRARSLAGMSVLNFHRDYIKADQDAVDFYLKIGTYKQGQIYE